MTAKVNYIFPDGNIGLLDRTDSVFFGLSLINPCYYGKRFAAFLKFVDMHFSDVLILTAGYLYRHHYRLFVKTDSAALDLALSVEKNHITTELNNELLISQQGKFKIVTWKSLVDHPDFKRHKRLIQEYLDSNEELQSVQSKFCHAYLEKKIMGNQKSIVSYDMGLSLINEFVLEEEAVFSLLSSMGHSVQIYPGEVFEFNNYLWRDKPELLKHLVNMKFISLKFHKSGNKNKRETLTAA